MKTQLILKNKKLIKKMLKYKKILRKKGDERMELRQMLRHPFITKQEESKLGAEIMEDLKRVLNWDFDNHIIIYKDMWEHVVKSNLKFCT